MQERGARKDRVAAGKSAAAGDTEGMKRHLDREKSIRSPLSASERLHGKPKGDDLDEETIKEDNK
jgi:hypothetical protein